MNDPMKNHFIIVCAYPDTSAKESVLTEFIEKLSKFENITICYSTHHPNIPQKVVELADYVIYNKENPILNWDIIDDFTRTFGSQANFSDNTSYLQYYQPYHGYAHHLSVCDGISIGLENGYTTFSLMNYDCIDFCLDELPFHISHIRDENVDAIFYPYEDEQFNTEFFTFTDEVGESLCEIRSYEDFSNFENMMYEKMVRQTVYQNKYRVVLRKFDTPNKSLGKIAFTGDHFSEVITHEKYFIPFFERWIEHHRYVYYFFPIIYQGKHCVTVIDESHESMNCHITINDQEIKTRNGEFYEVNLPSKLEMFENGEKKFSAILNDDRQFGAFFSNRASKIHPDEKIVL